MIFDFPKKPKRSEISEIERKISKYRRKNHSAPFQKKSKLEINNNFIKTFNRNKIKKNTYPIIEEKKSKLEATYYDLFEKKDTKNDNGQNTMGHNEDNIQIFSKTDNDRYKIIEDNPKKSLVSLINNNIDINGNNSIFSNSNNIKNKPRKTSNFSSASSRRNFILKSEIFNNFVSKKDKEVFNQEKYCNPVLEYYKDMNNKSFIGFSLFTEGKEKSKNDDKSSYDFENSNKNIISNNLDLNRKINPQKQIITEVVDEDLEENNCIRLPDNYNNDEKNELENKIKRIIFNNININIKDVMDKIKQKNDFYNGNEKCFDCYFNQNYNNRNHIEIKEFNNNINNNQNNFLINFNLDHNIYNIYQNNSKNIINSLEPQTNNNLNYYNFNDNQEIKNQIINFHKNNNSSNNFIENSFNINGPNFTPKNYNTNNYKKEINYGELNNKVNEKLNKNINNFTKYNDIRLRKNGNILIKKKAECLYLIDRIKNDPDFANNVLFPEIKNNIKELSCDPFGNYFFQALFDVLNFENINSFLDYSQKDIRYICTSPHGTHVIQKLVEKICFIPLLINKLIYNLCSKDLGKIFKSPHGNHIIQKILTCGISHEYYNFIYKYIFENFLEIAKTKYGVCVIQQCISVGNNIQRTKIYELILKDFDNIINDQFGNYLIHYILKSIKTKEQFNEILPIFKKLESKICEYCKSKFSANVIEKSFENSESIVGEFILENLLKEHSDNIIEILTNEYGIYVIKKAMKYRSGKYKVQIIKIIQSHLIKINSFNIYYIYKLFEENTESKGMFTLLKDRNKRHHKKEEKKYDNDEYN